MNKDDKPTTIDDIDFNIEPKSIQCPNCASFAASQWNDEETYVCATCGKQWRIVDGKVVYGVWIK